MQKTTSVQDFMVLTHVEPSDLHGPESLTDLTPRQDNDNPTTSTPEEFSPPWPNTKTNENDSGTPSSADALWSPSSSRSTEYQASDGSRVPMQDSTSSSQSETSNLNKSHSSEKNVNSRSRNQNAVISNSDTFPQQSTLGNTPNLTNIDISVTVASPRPESDCDESSMISNPTETTALQRTSSSTPPNKRRVFFKFDDGETSLPQNTENLQRPRRHTSTPKRSGSSSPMPPMNHSNGHIEDAVFENETSTNANITLNETCNLSPISIKRERSAMQSGELYDKFINILLSNLQLTDIT